MIDFNIKKKKRILILFIITVTMSFFNVGIFIGNFSNQSADSNIPDEFEVFNELKTSDYSSSHSNTGENMNIALHQSYLNYSFDIALNASDPNNSTFNIPCPTYLTFNSSYSRFDVMNIEAPNRTVIVEDQCYDDTNDNYLLTDAIDTYASFNIIGRGYLRSLSINISVSAGALIYIELYNSTWNSGSGRSAVDTSSKIDLIGPQFVGAQSAGWYLFDFTDVLLDPTETDNNTYFINVYDTSDDTLWYYEDESDGSNDSYTYYSTYRTTDLNLKCDFAPINNTPKPSEIGLKINGSIVTDVDSMNQGYWESFAENSSENGYLKYLISAEWWDVTCIISQVLINFTKTDLKASSEFNIAGSGQDVEWNVTRNGGLNYFDTDFRNYRINFTIPATWLDSSIKVFNGTDEWTIKKRLLSNGYRDVEVLNARNGTYWFLNATSDNLLLSIDTYSGTTPTTFYNFSQIVHFNSTFLENINDNDGIINLSVYSPLLINNELNYSIETGSFTGGLEISLTDWDISDNVTQFGDFRVQVSWSNSTAAGFRETTIRIFGETSLTPTLPSSPFDSSDTFDIEVFFRDSGLIQGIESATITYQIESGPIRTVLDGTITEVGNGYYNITIDCNHTDFNGYGPKSITINASKINYNNQSIQVDITIYGETDLVSLIPRYSFDSTESFDVALFFNDTVKDVGIDGATIEAYINQTLYNDAVITPLGGGNYNITIDCDDDIFSTQGYGDFNLSLNIENSYYYNKTTQDFIIDITGATDLSTTQFPDPSIGYYNSDEMFNITAYYRDIGRNEGINGGLAKIYIKEVSASTFQEYTPVVLDPYDPGYYNFTIDCSDPIFYPYGKYDIKINISKSNYYTAEDISLEIVIGNTTLTILEPTGLISHVEDEIFDIRIEYEDHTLSSRITGADITYSIEGNTFRSDNISPNVDDTYNITIDAGDAEFGLNYGYVDIVIRANKTNYINLTRTFTFERQITTQITPYNNPPLFEVKGGLNVTYTFNYSDTSGNPIVKYDNFELLPPSYGFIYHIRNDGDSNYTLNIDTSGVTVKVDPYTINFTISVFGNQSQQISLTVLLTIIQTRVEIQSWNDNAEFNRITWTNVSINFYYNDTTNIKPIATLSDSDVIVKDYYAGTTWGPGFDLYNLGGGDYKMNISIVGKNSGWYTLQINVSKYPDYNWSLAYVQFYLRGNYTQINMVSVEDPEELLIPTGIGNNYTTFLGSDLTVDFTINDTEWNDKVVVDFADNYFVTFKNLKTGITGTISESLVFNLINPFYGEHTGTIETSVFTDTGFYLINITVVMLNYENTTFSFNLTLVNSQINIISISNIGGQLEPSGVGNYYNSSIALDINLEFNITDDKGLNKIIARTADSYLVRFINLGTLQSGTISENFAFNSPNSYNGTIITSGLSVGNYLINISAVILDYKIIPLLFNLTIVSAESTLISMTNVGGQLLPIGIEEFFEPTIATDIDIEFNTTDAHFGNIIQIGSGLSYTIYYLNIDTSASGTIVHSLSEGLANHSGSLDISSLAIGNYSITIFINKSSNLVSILNFKLRIIYANSSLISITNPGGTLSPEDNFYETFEGSNIGIEFNTTDANFGNLIQIAPGVSYIIYYTNIDTLGSGTLQHAISEIALTHSGILNISQLAIGNYSFSIQVLKSGNNITSVDFQLRIIEKYETRITINNPEEVDAGLRFTIIIKAEYFNGSTWLPAVGSNITLILYYNSENGVSDNHITNTTGEIAVLISTYSDTRTLNITIELISAYYHQGYITEVSDIEIIPISTGFTFADILPYLIIAGIAVAAIGASVGIYRGVIVPKKREKARILTEVKTIFDDAINLEHILVLYKGTGTCIYFKSFGSEEIDPELISGFISAISSFGKDLVSQEELNEISYGDKMLLLSDGEHIRVALVLGKKASLILRRNLMEFIHVFEKSYANELPKWRGQLNIFRDAGILIDDVLNTSIILPHEISSDTSIIKTLKKPQSREVLKIANNLTKDTERNFFFIATLLKEATEKTGKETAEIFMGIKELRDVKVLMPIEIAAIETPPISQQEINLINQKVSGLVNLSTEERQKLVNDLSQMGPAEREAYFVSLSEQHEIVSAPVETVAEVAEIKNMKGAKKEIKSLKNKASKARKEKDYDTSMKILHNAVKVATTWELSNDVLLIDDLIRLTKIEDLSIKLKNLEKEAKSAAKDKKYNEAAQKYKVSSKIASEIFKLGVTEMTKEVKRLTNKAKEFEKLI
ncbi:MAG: hypothetical protein ACFFCV_07890 [Promethearchaeota archaeon]